MTQYFWQIQDPPIYSTTDGYVYFNDTNNTLQSINEPVAGIDLANKNYVDSIFNNILGITTVGTGPQYDYATMQLAIAAGHQKLYIATSITETVPITFAGSLTVIFADSVSVTFSDATPFTCQAASAILTLISEGNCQWVLNYNAGDGSIVNLDAITASPPSRMVGNYLIQGNSNPAYNVKPVSSRAGFDQLFYFDGTVVYVEPPNTGSYFDIDNIAFNGLFVIVGGGIAAQALNVQRGGFIEYLYFTGAFDISTYIATFQTSTTINKISNVVGDANSSIYAKDSVITSADGGSFGLSITLDGSDSTSPRATLNNSTNINLILTDISSSVNNCQLIGFDDSAVTSGIFNFTNIMFSSMPAFAATNGVTNYNFVNCSCDSGFNSMLSFSKWTNCTAGNLASPGSGATFTIPATADSVQINNCITDDTLIDNGTNSSFSYKIF